MKIKNLSQLAVHFIILLLLTTLLSLSEIASAAENIERPNIVLILADDLGYADVGFNGSEDIVTSNLASGSSPATENGPLTFIAEQGGYFSAQKNLRKWGTPVVADLDQDGWPDFVINDHGFGVRILWNDAGTFSPPLDLLMGDSHGVSVADFDRDGLLELIVARGGGSGKNARNSVIFRFDRHRQVQRLEEFSEPLIAMRGRTVKFTDLNADGAVDLLNFAFPSKERRGKSENYLYQNMGDGTLSLDTTLNAPVKGDGQNTLITDFDGDGHSDLLLYGNGPISLHRGQGDFRFQPASSTILPENYTDVTSALEIDYDNDGDFDLYLSRAVAFASGDTFYHQPTETWGFFVRRDGFEFDLKAGDLLNLVNYQSPWPHRQIYLGESAYQYQFPGETHSGKTLSLVNSDSLGWSDNREKQGLHAGYTGNSNWRIGGEVWSPTSGVVQGVSAPPVSVLEKTPRKLPPGDVLLENRNGKFVDVTAVAGLQAPLHTTGAVAADLDNDGDEDLFLLQRGNLVTATAGVIFINNGKNGFERLEEHQVVSEDLGAWGLGVAAVDYNRDGKVDLFFGNERGKWHLFRNESQFSGRHFTVEVGIQQAHGTATTLDGIVQVDACGKQQLRRVGGGSGGYERGFNTRLYFGLGDCEGPVKLSARWSDGGVSEKVFPAAPGDMAYTLFL